MIGDFDFDAGDRFTYQYNLFEHWLHDVRVEAVHGDLKLKAPFCISGHGMPGATIADEADKTLAFLEAIVNADDAATVGDIRPFTDDRDAVRFNRNKINRRLRKLDLASPAFGEHVLLHMSREDIILPLCPMRSCLRLSTGKQCCSPGDILIRPGSPEPPALTEY